jgi:carbonic anhydrase
MVRAAVVQRLAPDPMAELAQPFENNRAWAAEMVARDSDFFVDLAGHQSPEYLWIGCSDSRVPANQIVGLAPGDVFMHRNIANVVVHSRLCELNVGVQVLNVCETTVVEDAWARGQALTVHGLIYVIEDGLLRDLAVSVDSRERRAEISPAAARPGT